MNAKITQTKQKLLDALVFLTRNRSVHEVTVSELCRKAGVNRTTFYKYYVSPEDVAEEYFRESILRYSASIRESGFDIYKIILEICTYLSEDADRPKNLGNLAGDNHFVDKAIREFLLTLRSDISLLTNVNVYFIAGGISSVISHWYRHEPELPKEEVARLVADMVNKMG